MTNNERLTERDYAGKGVCGRACSVFDGCDQCDWRHKTNDKLAAYEDIGTVAHYAELVKAEKEGRIVVLPCKIGDAVFGIDAGRVKLTDAKIDSIFIDNDGTIQFDAIKNKEENELFFSHEDFNRSVFLTLEEAEAALRQKEGE